MRLIDADYLIKVLNDGGSETADININKNMPLGEIVDAVVQAYRKCLFAELEKVPTAYDVDKVVERLMCESINCHIMTNRAVEIVKSGNC